MPKYCFQFILRLLIYDHSNKMLKLREISIKGRKISEATDSQDFNQGNFFLFAKTSSTLAKPFSTK